MRQRVQTLNEGKQEALLEASQLIRETLTDLMIGNSQNECRCK